MTIQSFAASLSHITTDLKPRLQGISPTLFEGWVDRCPHAPAVISQNETLTYAEVEKRSNQIAHALCSTGIRKGDIVALLLERGPELVCVLMGILKAGAAFVALDPRAPKEALARTLSSVNYRLLITRQQFAPGLPVAPAQQYLLDDSSWFIHRSVARLLPIAGPDDPVCVLFTSGSSGQPKAVLYLHRNLAARFANTRHVGGFDTCSVLAQSSPITSIDAIDEILLPLIYGGCTAILPYETITDPHQLIASLSAFGVTHILLVPSLLRVILSTPEALDRKLCALKTWLVGGEPLTGALTRQFYKQLPNAVLINFYGLTEGDGTFHVTSADALYETGVPVGIPVQNTQVYLLDECLQPVPEGTSGEIYLAGEGLFHEYLNCPDLNRQRWLPNPAAGEGSDARIFRTGDTGRMRADGEIEYLGRCDRIVKVRGFRVDLSEVESILSRNPAVDQCVVTAHQPCGNDGTQLGQQTSLTAYALLKRGEKACPHDLRNFLRDHLPDFAVPAKVMILESFPLLLNGKVDIQALLQMGNAGASERENYVAPHTAMEQQLTQIWEKLLNVHPIGIEDSFFEIGGDSLAAIDLMLTLENEFQCQLPITTLLQSPTIASLAQILQGKGKSALRDSLVPIRKQGSRPPLFCIHADGSVFIYRRFADYLEPGIPIYGLQAHGLANPQDEPYQCVDDMAAHYIREIRTVQPRGPYHLCAFSAGGLIIFEMARQLQAQQEQVAFLGLLDAYGPSYPEYLPTKNPAAYKMSVHLNTLRLHGIRGQASYLMGRMRHRTTVILSRLSARLFLRLHLPLPPKIRYEYIARLIDRAAQVYPAGRDYSGDVVLFHACTQPEGIRQDRTLGWEKMVTGGLKIVDVIGTHNSIMSHEPHISGLVEKIGEQLNQLQRQALPTKNQPLVDPAILSLN